MKRTGLALFVTAGMVFGAHALEVDPQLPAYAPAPVGAAVIKSVGSDTMGELMRNWASAFSRLNPDVKFEIESKGSGTAPAALVDGASQLGPMSRPMRSEEYEPFEKKYGYHPASFAVAVDALAVYVNKDNPIQCLTIEQLDQIFSKTLLVQRRRRRFDLGRPWSDRGLGLAPDRAFRTQRRVWHARRLRRIRPSARRIQGPAEGAAGIGRGRERGRRGQVCDRLFRHRVFDGPGPAVPLAATRGDNCHDTSPRSTYSGEYPLARYLYVYLNKAPNKPLDPPTLEFVKYVLSKDGQNETIRSGFIQSPTRPERRTSRLSRFPMAANDKDHPQASHDSRRFLARVS